MALSPRTLVILTYYWPPSGGSGVQRWVYFSHYLKKIGWEPIVITVEAKQAAYPQQDQTLEAGIQDIEVIRTETKDPLHWYVRWIGKGNMPQGEVPRQNILQKGAAFIRGNFYVPDARKGWVPFASSALENILKTKKIDWVISTGPPHSTHLAVSGLKEKYNFRWLVDFRDPWSDLFYNQQLYRGFIAKRKDSRLERKVLQEADAVLTTLGGTLHDNLRSKAPKQQFFALPNGFDSKAIEAYQRKNLKGEFHLVYTGLLTRNQAYPALVNALSQIEISIPIRFSIAGQIDPEILDEINKKLPKVKLEYKGYLPHGEALALMHTADLLLNFIFEGADSQMISGKLLEYMAIGVPVLSLGNPKSEAGRLLGKGSASAMITATDIPSIITFIRKAANQKGHWENEFSDRQQWSREAISERLVTEILN